MSSVLPRLLLPALCVCVIACSDDAGENLPDGGFSTGEQTSGGQTSNPSTATSTSGPTTTSTADPTIEPTTTGTESSTTTSSDPSTTDTTDTTDGTTTDATTGTTGTGTTGDETTGPVAACDNDTIDDNEVCFVVGDTVATGATPSDIASGDFDGDGSIDVVVTSVGGNSVALHLGDATGGLAAAANTAVGTNPTRIMAAEFSGDTNWDALVTNTDDDTVSVLISDGAGGFVETVLTVGDQPVDLALADLDGANGLDFAVANAGDINYQTSVNDGAGNFTLVGPWAVGDNITEIAGVALGNIALNGMTPDAFFGGGNAYAATPGTGAGGVMNDGVIIGNNAGMDLARFNPGDFNGDGELDIAATDGNNARLFVGDGNNGGAGFNNNAFGPHTNVSEAVLADVTGEGNEDLIVTAEGDDQVVVYVGAGDSTFDDGTPFDVGTAPSGVAVADLNEDGVGDIIVCNRGSGDITILLSNP